MSAWLLKWPAELQAHNPMEMQTNLKRIFVRFNRKKFPDTYLNPPSTYITAASKLSTAQKANKNIPGPKRPMDVIKRRTDRTVHRLWINLSAKCPATKRKHIIKYLNECNIKIAVIICIPIPTKLLTIYGIAVKLILSLLAPRFLDRYVGSHCIII